MGNRDKIQNSMHATELMSVSQKLMQKLTLLKIDVFVCICKTVNIQSSSKSHFGPWVGKAAFVNHLYITENPVLKGNVGLIQSNHKTPFDYTDMKISPWVFLPSSLTLK